MNDRHKHVFGSSRWRVYSGKQVNFSDMIDERWRQKISANGMACRLPIGDVIQGGLPRCCRSSLSLKERNVLEINTEVEGVEMHDYR